MLRPFHIRVPMMILIFATLSSAQKKKSHDVSVSLMPRQACQNATFYGEQESTPFLKGARQVKVADQVQFHVGDKVMETFTEAITVRVHYRVELTWASSSTRMACKPFDPATLQFAATWINKSRKLKANGLLVSVQRDSPQPLCETECLPSWTYELQIEANGVPLTDDLSLIVDAADGTHIATLAGGLGPLDYQVNPAP